MSGYIRDESTIIVNGLPSSVDTAQLVRLFTALTKNEYPTISANVVPDSKRIGFRTGFLNFSKPASAAMAAVTDSVGVRRDMVVNFAWSTRRKSW